MKKVNLLAVMLFYSITAFSQQWQGIGKFNNSINYFKEDTTNDILYVSGNFKFINGDTIPGICYWDGSAFHKMGCGFDNDCHIYAAGQTIEPAGSLVQYNGLIYAVGGFAEADGILVNSIATWDGNKWAAIGSGLTELGGEQGEGQGALVYENKLYVYGQFDSINGIEAHGLAQFDGSTWSAVHNFPTFETTGNPNFVAAVAFYNGEMYVGGNFQNFPIGTVIDLVKWNGIEWVGVGGLTEPCEVGNMVVYNNELYVAGEIGSYSGGANGNNIIRFDGTNWKDVAGGVDNDILDIELQNDKMYVCGTFGSAGGVTANWIARWDGNQWCSYNSQFDNRILAIGFYRDTMYVGGGFEKINGDSIKYVARWVGGDLLFPCSTIAGIEPVKNNDGQFSTYPNPTNAVLHLANLPQQKTNLQYSIINMLGQVKQTNTLTPNNTTESINISTLPTGVYFITLTDNTGWVQSGKFVKE